MAEKKIDEVTGVETTGHVWDDDLQELNKPLPKWWLWVMYATIVWAVGYWVAYPAWPLVSDYSKGMLGYSQRQVVSDQVAAAKQAQSKWRDAIAEAELTEIASDPELLSFSIAGGASSFGTNCAPCHGRGAQGYEGYPNLNDDDWLWGGSLEEIYHTIRYGIRNDEDEARFNEMPAYGRDELLTKEQITNVAEYVLALSNQQHDAAAAKEGEVIFAEQCSACHGEKAEGLPEMGAPRLTDSIWLYGGDREDILYTLNNGRAGVMPPWYTRLDDVTIKQLAVYVHSLGGGQ